jgi:nucleoside-triphosphatase THEP1
VTDRFCSPVSFLASFLFDQEVNQKLFIITGPIGAGKTSWCLQLIREAQASGLLPCGLVSPAVFEAGAKTGIDLVDVSSGERRRLAVRRAAQETEAPAGLATQSWRFDESVVTWGNQALSQLQNPRLLILDELGPLELLEQAGLVAGLKVIDSRHYDLACVVIRPSLLPTALKRWPWAETLSIPTLHTAYAEREA